MIFLKAVGLWREAAPTRALAKLAMGGQILFVIFYPTVLVSREAGRDCLCAVQFL
jgi:hypothetical protein